jgi:hypothetical protein
MNNVPSRKLPAFPTDKGVSSGTRMLAASLEVLPLFLLLFLNLILSNDDAYHS